MCRLIGEDIVILKKVINETCLIKLYEKIEIFITSYNSLQFYTICPLFKSSHNDGSRVPFYA